MSQDKTTRKAVDFLSPPESDGETDAARIKWRAQRRADAKAASLLAARECPPDLVEWGVLHRIPEFARMTWQAGFAAGMRAAMIEDENNG